MFKTVLVALDLDAPETAERLVAAARKISTGPNSGIHVINVVPEPGMSLVGSALGPDHFSKLMETARQAASDWMSSALPEAAQLHVDQGTVYHAILKTADAIGADAIIVGAHHPQFSDYLVGSNAARVVRHAKQSVFVIR
ncbi:MAG: universal stress protein [Arenibacterium sp.]